ncbi:hypothetical protein PILCRDRAFT_72605 [Piloderma croceum F 1598]|uniref:BD-FAE-like domain-containing protein n=1 Tax=Piloderma croceum (strain F 1598) TaxID=765440 RepID=A0A0C3BTV0_PILCF|nr:hypothetical protein PILCRDRAFT_72605 [Piloderma croceum F 1598]
MDPICTFENIPYSQATHPNPLHAFDLYVLERSADNAPPPLVCFVHGGAWRSEDKAEYSELARNLVSKINCSVAIPNYRLTSSEDDSLRHPAHAEDLLLFLEFVITWKGPGGLATKPYDFQRIYLIGHSCSAHMLTSIFLDSSSITPTLTPSPSLLRAVQGIAMSEGIYDLELLLKHFPSYQEWFVAPVFGDEKPLSCFSTTTYALRDLSTHIRWLIIHSTGDRLINLPQSNTIFNHLSESYGQLAGRFVSKNFDKLTGGHNDILTKDIYIEIYTDIVWDFVSLRR